MTERDPYQSERDRAEYERTARARQRIEHIVETLGEPRQYGTVVVTYEGPDWATASGVFRAHCEEHDTYSYMTASHPTQLAYLAHVVRRYACPEGSHEA